MVIGNQCILSFTAMTYMLACFALAVGVLGILENMREGFYAAALIFGWTQLSGP